MLTQEQLRKIITEGIEDGQEAGVDMYDVAYDNWDEWLINSIGGDKVADLFGLKRTEGRDWELALQVYNAAAAVGCAQQVECNRQRDPEQD